jgi:hypothetical protein
VIDKNAVVVGQTKGFYVVDKFVAKTTRTYEVYLMKV